MARSRNLKPGFFKNEDLAACGMTARILFAGLWCFADRQGRLEDRPLRIKAEIFPYDTVDVNAELQILDAAKFIKRYEKNSVKYIQIINFTKHQNPHIKEQDSTIPAPDKHRTSTGNSGTCHALTLNPITDSLNPLLASSEKISLSTEGAWQNIPNSLLATWQKGHPAVNIETELSKAAAWILANPKNRKSNYARFLTNWLSRSQDSAPRASGGQPKGKIHRALAACDKVFGPMNKATKS